MDKSVTELVKFLCCIGIFLHHYYLSSPYVQFLGPTACVIFFFLSAYGICLSLEKHPVGLFAFLKKRLFKIYLPLLLVNAFFIFVTGYLCVGSFGIPIFNVFGDKIDFVKEATVYDTLTYVVGLSKIDGVTWFLDVLFASYIMIWTVRHCCKKSIRLIVIFAAYIIYVAISSQITPPLPYGQIFDPLGIVCGVFFAENKKILGILRQNIGRHVVFILSGLILMLGIMMGALSNLQGRYIKLALLFIAVSSIIVVAYWSDTNKIMERKLFAWLGGISYFVYLVHVKIANIVYCLYGEKSLCLSLVVIALLSVLLYYYYRKILKLL